MMKRFFWIFVFVVAFLVPFKVDAADLKLTYDNDFKKCILDNPLILPSYDDKGNISGHLLFYKDSANEIRKSSSVSVGMFKLGLNNKLVYDKGADELFTNDIDVTRKSDDSKSKIVYNGTYDILITGYDDNDEVLFETKYGGSGDEDYLKVLNSFNDAGEHDGYLIFLTSDSTDLNVDPGYILIKINLKGDIVWEKNINEYYHIDGLIYTTNKKVDSIFKFDDNGTISRVKTDGEDIWQKDTGINIFNINYSYNASGVIDGIVVVGMNDKRKGVIAKYDLSGNEIFRHSYSSTNESAYTDVISSMYVDGKYDGYIVTGATADNNTLIIKYDYSGKIVWTDEYSDSEILFFSIIRNYDNVGRPNGYLLYQKNINDKKRLISFDNSFSNYKVKRLMIKEKKKQYKVAKYTYENYPVKKDEIDEGEITVSNDNAYPGEIVKVSVVAKEGYVLKRIVVLDENGKEIEVSKNGTFVMPEGKVTVTAIYNRISNPETVSACYAVLGIILLISIGTLIVQKKKEIV